MKLSQLLDPAERANAETLFRMAGIRTYFLNEEGEKRVLQILTDYPGLAHVRLDQNIGLAINSTVGVTPLHIAAWCGNINACKAFIDGKMPIDALDDQGRSPLHWAAINNNADLCALLMHHHATVNSRNVSGATPFYNACIGGAFENAYALMMRGADPQAYVPAVIDEDALNRINSVTNSAVAAVQKVFNGGAMPTRATCFKDNRLTGEVLGSLGTELFIPLIIQPLFKSGRQENYRLIYDICSDLEPYWQNRYAQTLAATTRHLASPEYDPQALRAGGGR